MFKKTNNFLKNLTLKPKKINLTSTKKSNDTLTEITEKELMNILELPNKKTLTRSNILTNHNLGILDVDNDSTSEYINNEECSNVLVSGKTGSGKSHYLLNYIKEVVNNKIEKGESLVFVDYCKNSNICKFIKENTPKDKLVNINIDDLNSLPSLNFNELNHTEDDDIDTILNKIYSKGYYIKDLIQAMNPNHKLTNAGTSYLISACAVVYSVDCNASLNDIFECLRNYDKRMEFIDNIPTELKEKLKYGPKHLLKLNKADKKETDFSKIEVLLSLFNDIKASSVGEIIFNKTATSNIDFKDCFEEGKVILIELNDTISLNPKASLIDMLTSFFIQKALIGNMNKIDKEDYKSFDRVHLVIDEIYNAPYSMGLFIHNYSRLKKALNMNLVLSTTNPNLLPFDIKEKMCLYEYEHIELGSLDYNYSNDTYRNIQPIPFIRKFSY